MPRCMRCSRLCPPTVKITLPAKPRLIMTTTRVILVRHGQSTYNAEKRYQGSSDDSVLTPCGQAQAAQVGQICAAIDIQAIYSSPLQRTAQTAEAILKQWVNAGQSNQNLTIQLQPELREIDIPDWEGLPFTQVQTELASDYQHWIDNPKTFQMAATSTDSSGAIATLAPPTFPVRDLYHRADQFWRTTLPKHQGQTILIVSHGGTIRALTSTALGIPVEQFHYLQQSNAGVTLLEFDQFWQARLTGMNQTHHLGEILPKPKHGKQGLRLILLAGDDLPETIEHHLADRFRSTPISFSLTSPATASQQADSILQHHPQALHFEVVQDNFLLQWQQIILSQRDRLHQHNPATPTNALVIAPKKSLQALIAKMLQLPEPATIDIHPDTFSSIFYPAKFHHPVLQGFNIPVRP
jgi:phosphoserine phosphatase